MPGYADDYGVTTTHLSIRTSFEGSIELLLDPAPDDLRLGLGTSTWSPSPEGVRLKVDIVDELKET